MNKILNNFYTASSLNEKNEKLNNEKINNVEQNIAFDSNDYNLIEFNKCYNFLVKFKFYEKALSIAQMDTNITKEFSNKLSLFLCDLFFNMKLDHEEYVLSTSFCEMLQIVIKKLKKFEIFENYSHVLGLLISFKTTNFLLIEKTGIFKTYFEQLTNFLNKEVATSLGGIFYFLENYIGCSKFVPQEYIEVAFSYVINLIIENPSHKNQDIHLILTTLTEQLSHLVTPKILQNFEDCHIFAEFLKLIKANSTDYR